MSKAQILEISKNRAIRIFEDIGFHTANKWDSNRLQKKLGNLESLVEGTELSPKGKKRVDEVLQAQSTGKKIIVTTPEEKMADAKAGSDIQDALQRKSERKQKSKSIKGVDKNKSESKSGENMKKTKKVSKKKNKKRPTTSNSKTTKNKSAKSENVKLDKFGCRVGTSKAKFNSAISKKVKTMKELVEAAGLSGTFYDHAKTLVKDGHVTKTEKGYKLA